MKKTLIVSAGIIAILGVSLGVYMNQPTEEFVPVEKVTFTSSTDSSFVQEIEFKSSLSDEIIAEIKPTENETVVETKPVEAQAKPQNTFGSDRHTYIKSKLEAMNYEAKIIRHHLLPLTNIINSQPNSDLTAENIDNTITKCANYFGNIETVEDWNRSNLFKTCY